MSKKKKAARSSRRVVVLLQKQKRVVVSLLVDRRDNRVVGSKEEEEKQGHSLPARSSPLRRRRTVSLSSRTAGVGAEGFFFFPGALRSTWLRRKGSVELVVIDQCVCHLPFSSELEAAGPLLFGFRLLLLTWIFALC